MITPTFLKTPFAHRGLHDIGTGRPENSMSAVMAAAAAGYGVELDVQMSKDGVAMVFHDYDLKRLTGSHGAVAQKTSTELRATKLLGSSEGIPTLWDVLHTVNGAVPLLIEIKDQDGAMGENVGALEVAVAEDLIDYTGDVALMSFNPHSVFALSRLCPTIPRGLVTDPYKHSDWPTVPKETCAVLSKIPDYERTSSSFISHSVDDLKSRHVARLKSQGAVILCWTVTSMEIEAEARKFADNITFEGYLAELPAHVANR